MHAPMYSSGSSSSNPPPSSSPSSGDRVDASHSTSIASTSSGVTSNSRQGQAHARHPNAGPQAISIASNSSPLSRQHDLSPERSFAASRRKSDNFKSVRQLPNIEKRRILVTGGAGFLGSHLVDRLMTMGHDVIVLDNYFTGQKNNLSHWVGHPNFELVRHDVVNPIMLEVDQIYHLACPASPPHYQANQIKTLKTNFLGTSNMLGLAKRTKARFLLASTSEVYGDPEISPQNETYNGNVNQTGPRACYDEGKRVAETLTYGYLYQDNVDVRVARIFNTYGPRMNPYDGRVISNFLVQALKGQPMTIYGDGSQTRSFCYIQDLIDGLILLMNTDAGQDAEGVTITSPVNLGNGKEFTIKELVSVIYQVLDELSQERQTSPLKQDVTFLALPVDDPRQRRPDITRANEVLHWSPKWALKDGIREMALSYLKRMEEGDL